jgi:hypothetical protein
MIGLPCWNKGVHHLNSLIHYTEMFGTGVKPTFLELTHSREMLPNHFGNHSTRLSQNIFDGTLDANSFISDHTIFGAYESALPPQMRFQLVEELKAGEFSLSSLYHRQLRQQGRYNLCTSQSRSCPKCIERDFDELGQPVWRIPHFIPFLPHCAEHNCPLIFEPEFITKGLIKKLVRPTGKGFESLRTKCNSSEGFSTFVHYWNLFYQGELNLLQFTNWSRLMQSVSTSWSDLDELISLISEDIVRRWGVKPAALEAEFGSQMTSDFIDAELKRTASCLDIAPKLVVLTSLVELDLVSTGNPHQTSIPFLFEKDAADVLDELKDAFALTPQGIQIANYLFKNLGVVSSAIDPPCSMDRLKKCIWSLRTDLLQQVHYAFGSQPNTWASSELQYRRKRRNSSNKRIHIRYVDKGIGIL